MKAELQKKLFDAHPLLYGDRTKPMQVTCMCWGMDCGDGWFDLLWDLSQKLEPMIEEIRKKNKYGDCYNCGCSIYKHDKENKCTTVFKVPYRIKVWFAGGPIPQWKRDMGHAWEGKYYFSKEDSRAYRLVKMFGRLVKQDWNLTKWHWKHRINRFLAKLQKFGIEHDQHCHCEQYEISYPRASQVKEKFGTLSFYMTSATEEMWKLISEAEKKSGEICEDCGAPGELRPGGWIRTLCNDCEEAYQNRRK